MWRRASRCCRPASRRNRIRRLQLALLADHPTLRVRDDDHLRRMGRVPRGCAPMPDMDDLRVMMMSRARRWRVNEVGMHLSLTLHPSRRVAAEVRHVHSFRMRRHHGRAPAVRHLLQVGMAPGEDLPDARDPIGGAGPHQPSPRQVYCRSVLNSIASSTDPRVPTCGISSANACFASRSASAGEIPAMIARQNAA